MKSIYVALLSCVLGFGLCSGAQAQLAPHDAQGLTMGHMHLAAKDAEGMRKFFVSLGGVPLAIRADLIMFPGVGIVVREGGDSPPTGGTAGSTVNHIAFAVKSMKEARAKWDAAGVQWERGAEPTRGFVVAPEGVRVEIIENPQITAPIKFDHIHVFSDAAPAEVQAWYAKTFGINPGKQGGLETANMPGGHVSFSESEVSMVGTKGRALDHIGFDVKNLEQYVKALESRGVKFERGYSKIPKPVTTTATAFILDPWGTYIELTQDMEGTK